MVLVLNGIPVFAFELKNQYRESCPVLLQSGALYREEPTASAEAEETETAEATLPAEQEEAASPRTFLRLAFRNIDPRAVTSVYVDIHIFDKATNELAVVRDRRYLVPILGRDAVFGADEEIDVDDAAYSFSVAIKKVQFEGEDMFWNGSASLLFENLPEQAKIADVMEDEDLRAQYQRDFTEMAEDKEAAAQFVPQEYKDLWMCACGEVNHKDEEKCAACGAEYGPQHALFEDEEKLKENLEAYNKAEAEKAEAARIAAEKKAAEEKAAAEAAAAKKAAEMAKWGPNPIPADQLDGNAYTDDIYLTGKGITFFNIGQTELSPKEKLRLDIIATQIKNAPKNKIYVIEGHADPQTGSKAVNTRLAEQRAKKVYDYLISKGVKAENLQYKGYSDTKSPFKTEQENRVTVIR